MAQMTDTAGPVMTTADGTPLKQALARATRRSKIRAFLLVAPLLLFILVTFIIPIFDMLSRSVSNPEVQEAIPETAALLADWDGQGLPSEDVFASMAKELSKKENRREIGRMAARLNFEDSGFRSLLNKTQRRIDRVKEGPYKDALIAIDKDWGETRVWKIIQLMSPPTTLSYYLNALDRTYDQDGNVVMQPDWKQIYVQLFLKTIYVSLGVTVACLILAYPISYLLATLPPSRGNLLLILVLLPFWTSLLVRTTSWIVLLQTNGVINDTLVWLGVISDENRITMIYNMTGTVIAMTHILMPFMVLPLYSVMKTISPSYLRAARSLGANPLVAFVRVYMPQTVPGVGAGSILVFILAIGYYITPALVGGQDGQLISNFIAYHMQKSLNWGLAAALGTILLAGVLAMYWLYDRIVGIDNMKLG
ncbi:polyamine ABC transporter substrate-binding protein [Thalassobaculum fulvum]|jgi:putative spermidine/putrescine transport system permease protein|uniref:Polyamine ABC transporter substrate-binding protein n=1 Tax=Thalassobaculum fulvum TaxID=1633335 RepID=A0A919CQ78_9PROT|nr:ABC transporter permease [Thalassobaculum fulvum]GHD51151.1 polyamine ABC transporter substrate-binding protein [Thalassobaculum fulvum]